LRELIGQRSTKFQQLERILTISSLSVIHLLGIDRKRIFTITRHPRTRMQPNTKLYYTIQLFQHN